MSFNPQFAKLGDILVHENIISQDTLMQALDNQKITKKKLGDILIVTITPDIYVNKGPNRPAFNQCKLGFRY